MTPRVFPTRLQKNPFEVQLNSGSYLISEGYVYEISISDDTQIKLHKPDNFKGDDGEGDLLEIKLPLSGGSVYVKVNINSSGAVDTTVDKPVSIFQSTEEPEDTLETVHYKLASSEENAGLPIIKLFLSGSHIFHGKKGVYPPFFPTLSADAEGQLKLSMVTGFIHTQKNVQDAMVDLEVAGIPEEYSEISVSVGDKCFVSAQEDPYGTISEPQFGVGSDWPTSIPPVLVGGDNRTGTSGVRYWRLCEIISNNSVKIHRTGIIEHFIPRRVENASYNMSTNQGRFYKEYLDTDYGIYQMRVAWGLRGLCVKEEDDQTKNHLKLLMPIGSDGAILYFTGANSEDDEIGEWIKLDAPYSAAPDGYEWLLKNVPKGPPAWVQRPILPTGYLDDMLVHDGTKWERFAAPTSSGTYIHAYNKGHKWLPTEACPSSSSS
jgi:hypothetical protein